VLLRRLAAVSVQDRILIFTLRSKACMPVGLSKPSNHPNRSCWVSLYEEDRVIMTKSVFLKIIRVLSGQIVY
jgi:hypothetical protein